MVDDISRFRLISDACSDSYPKWCDKAGRAYDASETGTLGGHLAKRQKGIHSNNLKPMGLNPFHCHSLLIFISLIIIYTWHSQNFDSPPSQYLHPNRPLHHLPLRQFLNIPHIRLPPKASHPLHQTPTRPLHLILINSGKTDPKILPALLIPDFRRRRKNTARCHQHQILWRRQVHPERMR